MMPAARYKSGAPRSSRSFVGAAQASGTTITLPAHQAGDIIVMWATSVINTITQPSGWTGTAVAGGQSVGSGILAYKIAASSSEVSGTWTNAKALMVAVYRGFTSAAVGSAVPGSSSNPVFASLSTGGGWMIRGAHWYSASAAPSSVAGYVVRGTATYTATYQYCSVLCEATSNPAPAATLASGSADWVTIPITLT